MIALSALLLSEQSRAKKDLVDRFQTRGEIGARFVAAYLNNIAAREAKVAGQLLSDPTPTQQSFENATFSFGFEAAVLLDSQGKALRVIPYKQDVLGKNLSDKYLHLRTAVQGRTAVSPVVPSAAAGLPLVAVATPFDTPHGRRVISGGFVVGQSPLEQFIKNVLPFAGDVYLLDSGGRIAASTSKVDGRFQTLAQKNPALAAAMRRPGRYFTAGGEDYAFSSSRVSGAPLTLAMVTRQKLLFAPLRRFQTSYRLVFAGFLVVGILALVLLNRLFSREAQLGAQGRELEAKLEEGRRLNKALDEFSSRVAHDLRSPLANIHTTTDIARGTIGDAESRQTFLNMAHEEAQRGLDLIQGLLDMAKASGTPRTETLNLNEIAQELAEENPEVHLKWKDLPSVGADRLAIRQAISNLVRNAGLYAATNGETEVDLAAEQDGKEWRISVADRGPGLDPKEAERLFRPFERGRAQETAGTGLGLAIVATAAEAHGGRAWYEPRDGGGSRFCFSIPETTPS